MISRKTLALAAAASCLLSQMQAQQPFVRKSNARVIWRPYHAPTIPPIHLANSSRTRDLIRGGKLYLTLQDAIALAIENNLDLEVSRYGPLSAAWNLERAQAGGPLRGVTSGSSIVNQVTAGQGVEGALSSAGLSSGGGGGGGGGNNAVISQIGPVTQNLDTVFQNASGWSHVTSPQPNPQVSQTSALVNTNHRFSSLAQQGLLSGGYVQVSADESYLSQNSPSNVINPSVAPVAQIYVRHSLLNGFGTAVNSRFIRVAEKQAGASTEIFRSQLLILVANVVNLYWGLVADEEDLRAKQNMHGFAQKFYDDTRHEVEVGELAGVEILRAQAELSARTQEVAIAEGVVRQQEILLKNSLSRVGLEDPLVDSAEIVPLDRIQVPETEDLPPLRELVSRAQAQRPDIALGLISNETQRISALGTASGLLPSLQGVVSTTARATAGSPNSLSGQIPNPKIVGGLGTALAQIFRGDYTSQQTAVSFAGLIGNHVAQADYGIDQLQLSQGDLMERKNRNELVVEISNQTIALRQARARYSVATATRALQEDLLEKERQSLSVGNSSINQVIAAQRSLASAQYADVAALAGYSRARVALDQVLGQTLEVNHVSIEEALKGYVSRESAVPASVIEGSGK